MGELIVPSFEELQTKILNDIKIDIKKHEGSFTNNMISPSTVEIVKAYMEMQNILSLGFIETTFDDFLDRRVNEFGVYRKNGQKSVGEVMVTGEDGVIIEDGTMIKLNELYFITLNRIELPYENILYVEAMEVGNIYNLPINTQFELVEKNDKITNLIALKDFSKGLNIESDTDFRNRFVKSVSNPSTSGNKSHYEEWALQVQGVGFARVYPLWDGNGTVKVMISTTDNKPVSNDTLQATQEYIDEKKPIGCTLTVTTPTTLNINIRCEIEIKEGFNIDNIKNEFSELLGEYLKSVTDELVYVKVFGIMAKLEGVEDISNFFINDNTINITITEDKLIDTPNIEIVEVI